MRRSTLRTACKAIAFHDIVNIPRVGASEVPRLWRRLTDPMDSAMYAPEFGAYNCTHQPQWGDGQLMGIGLLVRRGLEQGLQTSGTYTYR